MNDILYKIAKLYDRKGDSAGSIKNIITDTKFIDDENDLKLFLFSIPRCTKYSFEDIALELTTDDSYKNVLTVFLNSFKTININYNKLFVNAIKNEAYDIVDTLLVNVNMQDLSLSNNGYECLIISIDKSYAIFDKVLGAVITHMSHTKNINDLNILELFMVQCIMEKKINNLASICTGCLFLTKDESAVKLLMNTAATIAFKYMNDNDIYDVVEDINSRVVLSKYLHS